MNIKLLFLLFLLIAFFSCSSLPENYSYSETDDFTDAEAHLDHFIEEQMKTHKVSGLTVALTNGQGILWSKAYGFADERISRPTVVNDIFGVGSISKLFTATAIMQLYEQGLIDLDAPITQYIPELVIQSRFNEDSPVTIRMLMSHYSGLPGDSSHGMWGDSGAHFSDAIDIISNQHVLTPPGYIHSYSNLGVDLLGVVIERVSGMEFTDYMDVNLLEPLEMEDSSFINIMQRKESSDIQIAFGHQSGIKNRVFYEPQIRDLPAGSLNGTVIDLSNFIRMILNKGRFKDKQIISEETMNLMLTPQFKDNPYNFGSYMGLSYFLTHEELAYAGSFAGHGGDTIYYHANLATLPDQDIGVILMTNSSNGGSVTSTISTEILKTWLAVERKIIPPESEVSNRKEETLSSEEFAKICGDYATVMGLVRVYEKGGRKKIMLQGREMDLLYFGENFYGVEYRLLGLFKIPINMLDNLTIEMVQVHNENIIIAHYGSKSLLGGKELYPVEISDAWIDRLGHYEYRNTYKGLMGDGPFPEPVLKLDKGYLAVGQEKNNDYDTLLIPISDTEALVAGIGRGRGYTLYAEEIEGITWLYFGGWEMAEVR